MGTGDGRIFFSRLLQAVLVALLLSWAGAAGSAERRVALVVGIADYERLPRLANTINDTVLIGKTLGALQFEVRSLTNPGLIRLRQELAAFAFEAETADVALVYFAGHGVEVAGRNYLIPADSRAQGRQEVAETSLTLDEVLRAVDKARQLRIVILDSCRDDPFIEAGKSATFTINVEPDSRAGLAKPSPERGTLVAFAAEAGEVALDGEGSNSPFALALAENMPVSDLEIGLMFRRVRDSVLARTSNRQEPHTYGSLSGSPYFLAGPSREANILTDDKRRQAWARVAIDHVRQLEILAAEGDTRAMKGLAYMRLNPEEARYAPSQGAALLEKAADAGDPEAMFELGRLLERGIGVNRDVARALELYRNAADLGFADAINDLGFLHFQGGEGIVRDQKRALELFARAADLRHPEAMFNYAALIDDGLVDGKGPDDAARYLYEALRSGNEEVLAQLSENPNMFKPATRLALQRLLAEVAMYEGAIDGQFGPATRRGLRRAYGVSAD